MLAYFASQLAIVLKSRSAACSLLRKSILSVCYLTTHPSPPTPSFSVQRHCSTVTNRKCSFQTGNNLRPQCFIFNRQCCLFSLIRAVRQRGKAIQLQALLFSAAPRPQASSFSFKLQFYFLSIFLSTLIKRKSNSIVANFVFSNETFFFGPFPC